MSGLTGVGKSTLQAELLRIGCWSPTLVTSRSVEVGERALLNEMTDEDMARAVRDGTLVAPVIFAGKVYAWGASQFERLRLQADGAVLTTRPYTALLLSAAIPKLIPVWLNLSEAERERRLAGRAEGRDRDHVLAERRRIEDSEDVTYKNFFAVRIEADQAALPRLTALLKGEVLS